MSTPESLLAGTPYLPGDSDPDRKRFAEILARSAKVAVRAEEARERLKGVTAEATAIIRDRLRYEQVAESNQIEGYNWTPRGVREVVEKSGSLLNSPLRDLLNSVRSDPHAFQALGLYQAHLIAENWASSERLPSEVEIRQLHHLITAGDKGAGEYRIKVGTRIKNMAHQPPHPMDVPFAMTDFMEWWQQPHPDPLLAATVAHAWLTHIHPFDDGNGRLARLLANIALIQGRYPPLVVRSNSEREQYYDALSSSDTGDIVPLFDLFAQLERRTAVLMSKPSYIERLVQDAFSSTSARYTLWLETYKDFRHRLDERLRQHSWRLVVQGVPGEDAFELLSERSPEGNSWAAKLVHDGAAEWLMWYGFRSWTTDDHLGPTVQPSPSLFLSPRSDDPDSIHPFRRRGETEGAADGVPDEIVIVSLPRPVVHLRIGHEVMAESIDAAATFLASQIAGR